MAVIIPTINAPVPNPINSLAGWPFLILPAMSGKIPQPSAGIKAMSIFINHHPYFL